MLLPFKIDATANDLSIQKHNQRYIHCHSQPKMKPVFLFTAIHKRIYTHQNISSNQHKPFKHIKSQAQVVHNICTHNTGILTSTSHSHTAVQKHKYTQQLLHWWCLAGNCPFCIAQHESDAKHLHLARDSC